MCIFFTSLVLVPVKWEITSSQQNRIRIRGPYEENKLCVCNNGTHRHRNTNNNNNCIIIESKRSKCQTELSVSKIKLDYEDVSILLTTNNGTKSNLRDMRIPLRHLDTRIRKLSFFPPAPYVDFYAESCM